MASESAWKTENGHWITFKLTNCGDVVKYEDIYLNCYESGSSQKVGVALYLHFDNTERFHQDIDYRTADDMYDCFRSLTLT